MQVALWSVILGYIVPTIYRVILGFEEDMGNGSRHRKTLRFVISNALSMPCYHRWVDQAAKNTEGWFVLFD